MRISKNLKVSCCIMMSLLLANVPAFAVSVAANTTGQMISTTDAVMELTRSQAQETVQGFMDRSEVKEELMKRGLSAEEVNQRLASLSDAELKQLAGQMEQARYGGDILVTILIVVLIIYLVKRI